MLEGEDAARPRSRPAPRAGARSTPRWPSSTAGAKVPSVAWRQRWSLLLGLERLLCQDEPHLADGTVLSAHQVDALSGTLTALLAEAQRNGNAQRRAVAATSAAALASVGIPGEEDLDEDDDEPEEPQDWDDGRDADDDERSSPSSPRIPNAAQALLVRARDRRRQDGRRARLRRGLAHRRHR